MKFPVEMTEHGVKETQETVLERFFGQSSRAYGTGNHNRYWNDMRIFATGVAQLLVGEKVRMTSEAAAIMLVTAIEAIKKPVRMESNGHRLQSKSHPTLTLPSSPR